MKFYEKNERSIVKTITYRIFVILSDIVVIYALTRNVNITFGAVVGTNVVTTFLYYFHERIWNFIRWGKVPEKNTKHK